MRRALLLFLAFAPAAALAPVAPPPRSSARPAASPPRGRRGSGRPSRPSFRPLRVAKWSTAALTAAVAGIGLAAYTRADDRYRELERACVEDPDGLRRAAARTAPTRTRGSRRCTRRSCGRLARAPRAHRQPARPRRQRRPLRPRPARRRDAAQHPVRPARPARRARPGRRRRVRVRGAGRALIRALACPPRSPRLPAHAETRSHQAHAEARRTRSFS